MASHWFIRANLRTPERDCIRTERIPSFRAVCRRLWLVISAALLISPALSQTSTGQFNGHIADPTGASLANLTVELLETQTGLVRRTTTNGSGNYLFTLVPPGVYRITVEATGFATETTKDLNLLVNQNATNDFVLKVGQTSQTVTVSSQSEMLQASSSELGTVIENRSVNNLPLNGRNFTSLLALAPGVNPAAQAQAQGPSYGNGGSPALPTATLYSPSVQGQWAREIVFFVDGIIDSDSFFAGYNVPPIVDDTQEFKIQSHNDGAEFGGVLGGVINVVTKSGTNSFHGALWDYLRNNAFDARNPFTDFKTVNGLEVPSPPGAFHQNQFGVTVGGPVRIPHLYNGKDKTFFFFGYEGWRYTAPAGNQYNSPTDAEISGDFSASVTPTILYDPALTTAVGSTYTRPLLGDGLHIPTGRIDTLSQNFIKNYFDRPNIQTTSPSVFNTLFNAPTSNNADEYTGRIDQNFGQKDLLWFRWSQLVGDNVSPETSKSTNTSFGTYRNFGGGITHVIKPNFVLDGRVGYSSRNFTGVQVPTSGLPATGFSAQEAIYGHLSYQFDGQYYSSLANYGPSQWTIQTTNYAANATYVRGAHQIRFGFEQVFPESLRGLKGNQAGSDDHYSFDKIVTSNPSISGTTGNELASALLGLPTTSRFQDNKSDLIYFSSSIYGQDTWKITPNLTLNLGLRYDRLSTPHLKLGIAAEIDPNTGNYIISGGKLPPSCAAQAFAPCIPTGIDPALASKIIASPNPNLGPDPVNNFGPRLGFAYKLPSHPTVVLRGGYGIVYDTLQGQVQTYSDRINAWPANNSINGTYNQLGTPLLSVDAITPTVSSAKSLPASPTPFTNYGWYFDPKMKNHLSHQYNIEVQKELTTGLVASLAYVGSVSRRLPLTALFNVGSPGSGGSDRLYPYQVSTPMATDRGTGNYNAGEVTINKRLTSGFQALVSYTWSKTLDNGASGFYGGENISQGDAVIQDYNNLKSAYGVSGYNVGQLLSVSSLYELPLGNGKRFLTQGVLADVLGGWQTNTILQAHSGLPLLISDSSGDPLNVGNNGVSFWNYARANQTGNPHVSHPTKTEWFNTSAFAIPTTTYGNSGRNPVNGPTFDNVDFSLFKTFPIKEYARIQFRAETFNIFNIQNYNNPNTSVDNGRFGTITSLATGAKPRQIQFALRVEF